MVSHEVSIEQNTPVKPSYEKFLDNTNCGGAAPIDLTITCPLGESATTYGDVNGLNTWNDGRAKCTSGYISSRYSTPVYNIDSAQSCMEACLYRADFSWAIGPKQGMF